MTRFIGIAICLFFVQSTYGQNEAPEIPPKIIPEYHFNVAYAKGFNAGVQHVEIGLNKDLINVMSNKLRLGLGVRLGLQDNNKLGFTSAHSGLKRDDIDTIYVDRSQSVAFNFYFNGEYHFSPHVALGGALDLLGISVGGKRDGEFRPGKTSQDFSYHRSDVVEAFPTASNVFAFGNSKGSVNAQLYGRIALSRKVSLRLGVAYLFQEYSTDNGYGAFSAYRFQNNNAAFFGGLSFNRFDEK